MRAGCHVPDYAGAIYSRLSDPHPRIGHVVLQGSVYVLEVSGGECVEDGISGRVTCSQPAVTLVKTAGGCNLPYTGPSVVQARTQAIRHVL